MLNIATMGILKGNANPETPGGEKRPPKGEYVKYIHIPYGGYVQYVQSALGDNAPSFLEIVSILELQDGFWKAATLEG